MAATRNVKVSFNFELPMELIFDILSRLPVESLLRFKSVCKTWYALIQNPNFIKAQLTTSDQNKLSLLSIGEVNRTPKFSMWLQSSEKTCNLTSNPNFLFKRPPRVVGIFNGLVCAMLDNSQAIICNPTIGRLRKIPLFKLPIIEPDCEFLGFVFQDNDYKLFRIIYSRVSNDETFIRGEVYIMSSDAWSNVEVKNGEVDIQVNTRGLLCHRQSTPVAMNEVFYWMARVNSCVAYFDMQRYVFGLIRLPMDLTGKSLQLLDLKGQLALLIISGYEWFELWVFKEKERSWTMMHRMENISLISWKLTCLGCERNDKLVMTDYSRKGELKMFLYDQETREITYLPFSGIKKYGIIYLYTESLLWHDVEKNEDKCNSQGRLRLLCG